MAQGDARGYNLKDPAISRSPAKVENEAMENVRLHGILRVLPLLVLAAIVLGCEKEANGPDNAPVITESDVTGTWRTSVPVTGFTVKVVMEIAADHSMNFSQKYAGLIKASPDSVIDRSYESGMWALTHGVMKTNKVTCRYAVEPSYQLQNAACEAPVSKEYSLGINGNKMTVVEGTTTYVFTRD